MNVFKKTIFYALILTVFFVHSQEIPPIDVFTPLDYNAEDQNWSISQSQNNFIYVANNKGLIEYNGASWKLYNSPNEGILRSVHVVEDRVYTGGYMDFGFWTKNQFGDLVYESLVENKNLKVKEDEEFWGIIDKEGFVLFQSFERIYIYSTTNKSLGIIESSSRINKIFKVNETIYFQKSGVGVFKIENGKDVFVTAALSNKNFEIINIFDNDNSLLLLTKEHGFFEFKNNKVENWDNDIQGVLSNVSIYSNTKLKDGSYLLGTISNGIIQLDSKGKIILQIDQSYGLSNNTVLSIKEDNEGNVWLGLDNGINVLNLNSPYREYKDKLGVLGTVYASLKTDQFLYLGTNQGLFYKEINSDSNFMSIPGTEGQVWCLKIVQGTLFCGHDKGTYIINNNRAEKIASEKGTWTIKNIDEKPNLLIQGNYRGFNILEKTASNDWKFRNKINGFDMSSKFFEFSKPNEILVSHEHKGVFKIEIDSAYENVLKYKKLPIYEGIKSSVFKYNNAVFYCFKGGVFYYDDKSTTFKKDSILSSLIRGGKYLSGKIISDQKGGKLWAFTQNEIIYLEPGKLTDKPEVNIIGISDEVRKSKSGYENILHLNDNKYLIGTTDGYLIIDVDKLDVSTHEIYLNNISYNSRYNEVIPLSLEDSPELKNKNNSIRFNYSITNYNKLVSTKYQFRLTGIYDAWSNWSPKAEVFFENLPFGDYRFEVRAMSGGVNSSNTASYSFTIEKPWYLKPLAIVLYVLLVVIAALLVHYFNRRYYKKQKQKLLQKKERELELEQLESQRQIMQFKNENLQLDIENKNRELGMATMNLVKRNEFLNNIKDELSQTKSLLEVKKVIKLINSNLNNSSDWQLFEEAFNNVDKDFMKKIKAQHPSITPNDLRLCAYLRLNLSSKEIAPLLNISHKSVEVKRYRLRKKMGLVHDQSLSNYIIEL
jgi:DNA-binding CsgD family transcriptional regulator/ligand-binding sensor domain-containing protein